MIVAPGFVLLEAVGWVVLAIAAALWILVGVLAIGQRLTRRRAQSAALAPQYRRRAM